MIRRWWTWRVVLAKLRKAERHAWRAYARAHALYIEAATTLGYPGAIPQADVAKLAGQFYEQQRRALQRHLDKRRR